MCSWTRLVVREYIPIANARSGLPKSHDEMVVEEKSGRFYMLGSDYGFRLLRIEICGYRVFSLDSSMTRFVDEEPAAEPAN